MAHTIRIARSWWTEHLADCFFSYDEATQENHHLGDPESIDPNGTCELAEELRKLERKGYYISHRSNIYSPTLYKDHLHPIPLEWQILAESKEPEYIQDW